MKKEKKVKMRNQLFLQEQKKQTDNTGSTEKTNGIAFNNINNNIDPNEVIKEEENSVSGDSNTSFEKLEKNKLEEIDELLSGNNNQGEENRSTLENGAVEGEDSDKKIKDKTTTLFKLHENMIESKHIGPKQKQVFGDIKGTLDQFVNEFNFYFYEHVFQRFTEHIQKLMDEKYTKYIEISKNYHGQIKEMEFLLTGDGEDQHKDGIKAIIEQLKEEQDHELDRIEDHYNRLIVEAQNNFKSIGFKNNPGVQLVEEKFKLDMYNLINMILVPKK